ncbi:MAG: tetratricopeptide repeat protein [Candidatus Eiseniibacteriota bacterium]
MLLFVVTAAVIAGAYLHTLDDGYAFDDYESIRDNPTLDHWRDIGPIWHFRPSRFVVHMSLALNVATSGRSLVAFRLTNLVIHWLCAVLVGWIAVQLLEVTRSGAPPRAPGDPSSSRRATWIALAAALVFAAHPLATQAVTYLIQRTTSLAALLELGAVATYLGARARQRARGTAWTLWGVSWALAVLAAFTKEMAFALPFLIAMIELVLRQHERARPAGGSPTGQDRQPARRTWPWLLPYLAVVPIIAVTTQLPAIELDGRLPGLRETTEIGRAAYLWTELVVIPRYLALAIWPAGQNLDHDVPLRPTPDLTVAAGALLLVALTLLAWRLRRRWPLVTIGWLWCLIALLPESSLIPISDVMNEHRTYLPLAGLVWPAAVALVTAGTAIGARWRSGTGSSHGTGTDRPVTGPTTGLATGLATAALLVAVVVPLAIATHERNMVWRDELTLWRDVTRKSPGKARGYNNLGLALAARGRLAAAEKAYRRAIELDPDYVYARVNLGQLYGTTGRPEQALELFEEAVAIDPEHVAALNNLGTARWTLGDLAGAEAAYRQALAVAPQAREPRRNLMRLLEATGASTTSP